MSALRGRRQHPLEGPCSLRASGVLLVLMNVHLRPQTAQIEVPDGVSSTPLGRLVCAASFVQTIAAADEALASFHKEGRFPKERS